MKGPRSKIPGRVDITLRPFSVESRRYFGDWEIDLVEGSKGTGFILSMVERKSRYSIFEKIENEEGSDHVRGHDKTTLAVQDSHVGLRQRP